jgi:Family of unknown function (DUF5320)
MPVGDRTGPLGFGPMTGRRAGYCGGFNAPGFANPAPGYGMSCGYGRFGGRGRGWRHWYHATGLPGWARAGYVPPAQEQELAGLKNEAEWLKGQLEAINRRIEELEQKE